MIASVRASGDEAFDWASWHKTELEISRGYAEGPFPLVFREPNAPLHITVSVAVFNLSEISMISHSFQARLLMYTSIPITQEEFAARRNTPKSWQPDYFPTVFPYNAVQVLREENLLWPSRAT